MTTVELLRRLKGGALVFLDGRNEFGSHVLASYPTFIPLTDDDCYEVAERIISDAEALGYAVGDHVWTQWQWIRGEYHHGEYEYVRVDAEVTQLLAASEEAGRQS